MAMKTGSLSAKHVWWKITPIVTAVALVPDPPYSRASGSHHPVWDGSIGGHCRKKYALCLFRLTTYSFAVYDREPLNFEYRLLIYLQ
jgi:hypothetical protein